MKKLSLVIAVLASSVLSLAQNTPQQGAARVAEIREFNEKFTANILHMDNAAIVGQWADDGVSLLPGTDPIVGKAAIQKMMDDVVAKMPGYKVTTQEDDFRDIAVTGDWATEWALTHQIVKPPTGDPIEIRGKMLLVLHRENNGEWKIEREAWTR